MDFIKFGVFISLLLGLGFVFDRDFGAFFILLFAVSPIIHWLFT